MDNNKIIFLTEPITWEEIISKYGELLKDRWRIDVNSFLKYIK